MRRESRACRRTAQSVYLPWRNEGGPSTWPLVLLADRGITLVGSNVSAWADVVTGNGLAAVQATSLAQPAWVSSDSHYGGAPSLDFSSSRYMAIPSIVLPQPCTYYVLAYTAAATPPHLLMQAVTGPVQLPAYWSSASNKPVASAGTSMIGASAINASTATLLRTTFNNTSSSISISDATQFVTTTGNAGANNANGVMFIGCGSDSYPTPQYHWQSTIAAILVAKAAHDLATELRIKNWLKKWMRGGVGLR